MSLPADAMSDTVHGQDVQFDAPTLSKLKATHDWRTEERAGGRYIVDVCGLCGYEESAGSHGRTPDCEVREVPSMWTDYARRRGLLPESQGARTNSMLGQPAAAKHSTPSAGGR